jgi:hypothetical protein
VITRRTAVQASLLAAFLPSFLSSAWAASAARTAALFDAHRRAVERGRPLLVLLVPAEQATWSERGQAFGPLLNHGGDEALAALALCEVACGDVDDVAELAGQPVPADAWYALVETDRVPGAVRFAKAVSAELPPRWGAEDWVADSDAAVEAAIRVHRDAVVGLVLPDRAALVRYVAQAEAADAAAVRLVRGTLDAPDPALVARAPAVLALAATDGEADRLLAATVLAEVGRDAVVEQVVPGSRWARAGGCGLRVEGAEDNVAMGCGMGFVSAKASRMLHFYEDRSW